jgi:DNA-binding NarL/FixJ family response regulator
MNKTYKIVIIDDHPLITESYKAAVEEVFAELNKAVKISVFNDLDSVLIEMSNVNFLLDLDLILLDIQLPSSENNNMRSGEDLGMKIRKMNSPAKILVSTTFNDNHRIYSILKSFNPEGFLIKNDINRNELLIAIKKMIQDPPYYSKTVVQLMRKRVHVDFVLDINDRKILYELSIGTKLKDLQKVIPLSLGGIEKKRRNLKLLFGVEDDSDRTLVIKAKEKGFI